MFSPNTLYAFDAIVAILGLALLSRFIAARRKGPFPPGPKGWPFMGNALDMPTSHHWKIFSQWSERWGDIVYVTVFGQPMVILNSLDHATELLERRSALYSDRPQMTSIGKIAGWDQIVVLTPYGAQFREHRRLLSRYIGSHSAITKFAPVLEHEVTKLIMRIIRQPKALDQQLRRMAAAVILNVTYGYEMTEDEDPLVEIVDTAVTHFSELSTPGARLADMFPVLEHVPAWLPGAGWKRRAFAAARDTSAMVEVPYAMVRERMASGTAIPSFVSSNLEGDPSSEQQYMVKTTASVMYAGGADTTVSTLHSFFLAMTCYPEVQKKAQMEIDNIIGNDRLPTLGDRESLPYVNAVCSELHRWNPAAPLGVTHRLVQDDTYLNFVLPKGTLVTANAWHILHDPANYKDPFVFNPDRFVKSHGEEPEMDPRKVMFGFGRRICAGKHFADASVFLTCATILATLDISKAVENGVVNEPIINYGNGTVR
ncbi:uncharacterized protein FIBRA_03254 [Fibroporia radiculosa]|uniref:Cytochrome P450 n=1 Tax=Fibroporia radiculosa TaxID=599839 RepID=J4I9I2_9APHY|nr:uncharacterized protein FIBRA_03254 [Fibroporia radiculosa]CCM01206.1 predicted protein [Fibroporia radiculosa]